MSGSNSNEELVNSIFHKELSKAAKSAAILYIVVAAAYLLIGRAFLLFYPSSPASQLQTFLEAYSAAIAVYAVLVYLLSRSQRGSGFRAHFYILALLGLTEGGFFGAFGAIRFLSLGYWLGQFQRSSGIKCARDNGDVVAYGRENLACRKCSKLVKIGLDLPRRWGYTGVGLVIIGVLLYFSAMFIPVLAALVYATLNIPFLLVFDGAVLSFEPVYFQRAILGGGYVRLPPDQTHTGPVG